MNLPLILPCDFDKGYQIKQSLWFSNQSSTYAVYPSGTAADTSYAKKTFSFWLKKAKREQTSMIFTAYSDDNHRGMIYFSADQLVLYSAHLSAYGGINCQKITTRKFKDTTNWYHIFIVTDTSLATAEDRVQLWVNGERITSFSTNTNPGQNQTLCWNVLKASGWWACWGRYYSSPYYQLDGMLAEVHVIDGTAKLVTDFGYRDAVTGQWRPKRYTGGSYGNLGGYYPWDDPTSLTTLGYDRSGSGNHLTCGGFSLTTTAWNYAPSKDTPTNNHAAMNWNDVVERNSYPTYLTYYPNNLFVQGILSSMWRCSVSTLSASKGKWYFEASLWCVGSTNNSAGVGIAPVSFDVVGHPIFVGGQIYYGVTADSYGWYTAGYKLNNGSGTAWGVTYANGGSGLVRVAVDLDNGKIWFGDVANGWWGSGNPETGANPAFTIPTGVEYRFGGMAYNDGAGNYGQVALNFGAQPFNGTQPAGYKTLCAKNLPNPQVMNPRLYFDMDIYSGNGTTRDRTGFKFQPGFAGFKARNYNGIHHGIVDRVRGVDKIIYPSGAIAEGTDATGVTSFNSDGYSLGSSGTMNANGYNYVSWLFRDPGAAITNNDGSISAQVSADPQRGYSIISYQGNGSAGATVGHGLGKVPALMMVKYRQNYSWVNYHKDMNASPATGYMDWDNTINFTSASVIWNNTAPTSSVFTIGTNAAVNTNTGWHIAYCFAEIPGFMAMGSYYGKGQHNFQHCGFTPRFIMIKCCYGYYAGNWVWIDTKRDDVPPIESALYFNSYGVEGTLYNGGVYVTSNGFDIADYVNTDFDNYDGSYGYGRAKYVWWAIADMPMKYGNAR